MSNDNQSTPQAFFEECNRRFGPFGLDAAADADNTKCPRWFGPGGECPDALTTDWPTDIRIWLNPPYSRGMQRRFVAKCVECANRGGYVLALLPSDTSTKLFHYIYGLRFPIHFIKGRLKFNGVGSPAKFGSMLVEFTLPPISPYFSSCD